jgi:hypothetical protein
LSSSAERKAELARRWEAVKLSIGHAEMYLGMTAFHRSRRYWQRGEVGSANKWSILEHGDLYLPRAFNEEAAVLVEGDCRADLSLSGGGLVQIFGDLSSKIEIGDQGEVVIGGNFLPGASIEADGIHDVFVGDDLNGTIRSLGSLDVWVGGDFGGAGHTGHPSTHIHVEGNMTGHLEPTRKASLLLLDVNGFMSYAILESISRHGYTQFNASIGSSDRPPGIYPEPAVWAQMANQRHFCYWTIHATRPAERASDGLEFSVDLGRPPSEG